MLVQKGRGSATWYQPTEWFLGATTDLSANPSVLSSNPGVLSSNPKRCAILNELPGELAARVGALGKRRPPEEVCELVVALCRQRIFRVEELASLLARTPETVRQSYLRPLLLAGRISMIRPEVPNDPEQAYRTVAGKT